MKEIIPVDLGERSYDVVIGHEILANCHELLKNTLTGDKVMVIYDRAVASPWKEVVVDQLQKGGFETHAFEIPTGEMSKSPTQLAAIWDELARLNFTRDSAIVAVGGGVIGDLAGFAAASFLRGIPFVQVPTSLLAMVDSSVGGKTGINLSRGKNLVGAFWQPDLVLADLAALKTLPAKELNAGFAEVIKYGVIYDAEFFAFLEKNVDAILKDHNLEKTLHIVKRSVEIKADVVKKDEREGGLRRILNFGHTVGHAIEAVGNYTQFIHGEGISIGMIAASLLTVARGGGWTQKEHDRLEALIAAAGLPTRVPENMNATGLVDRTHVDKKALKGTVRYVLPTRMGEIETVSDVTDEQVAKVLVSMGAAQKGTESS